MPIEDFKAKTFQPGVNPFEVTSQQPTGVPGGIPQDSIGFQFPNAESFTIGGEQPVQNRNTLGAILNRQGQSQVDRNKLRDSGIGDLLNSIGLQGLNADLTFDSAGRTRLLDELRKQFGETFKESPTAQKLLKDFEGQIKTQAERDRESAKTVASGRRTIEAIFGGLV